MFILIAKEPLNCRQQEGPETPFLAVYVLEKLLLNQSLEKPLCQVLRLVGLVALSPNEHVNRRPILPAKLLQRPLTVRGVEVFRVEHDTPVGRTKTTGRRR